MEGNVVGGSATGGYDMMGRPATIATNLGRNATMVNERLITLESDDEMSGRIPGECDAPAPAPAPAPVALLHRED